MNSPWRIELFGGFSLIGENDVITRFQTHKTAALLAYLAYHRDRVSAREVLAELLWPNTPPDSARNSLRVALNSLRRQLEPPGVPVGGVLLADRTSVRLHPEAFVSDVQEFETYLKREKSAVGRDVRIASLRNAVTLYRGPLLSGWYEEWIDLERTRLAEVHGGALRRLTALMLEAGQYLAALEYARRAVHADPLREDAHRLLMRLYGALQRPDAARQQYENLSAQLRSQLNIPPSQATLDLWRQIESGSGGDNHELPPEETESSPPSPVLAGPDDENSEASSVPIGSIPPRLTRFWGRESELALLHELLSNTTAANQAARFVTLTGPGGTGKSRLAIEAAARFAQDKSGYGCWVIPLGEDNGITREQLEMLLLLSLRLPTRSDSAPLEQITSALLPLSDALIVLDDVTALPDASAKVFLHRLWERLPGLRILVTSRQRLGIREEREIVLATLPLPNLSTDDWEAPLDPAEREALAASPSVALFVDRAKAVRPDFQITARNAGAIAELCRRLDGLPLALELAAAWIRLLSPAQMLGRLEERFDLLTGDRRRERREGGQSRIRSLRAVMEESFRLLPDPIRQFLARLGVFRGGWSLEAAQAVALDAFANDAAGAADALLYLEALRQRSLVVTTTQTRWRDDEDETGDSNEGVVRFSLLETVRFYAEQLLPPDELRTIQEVHRRYFLQQAQTAFPFLAGERVENWLAHLDNEQENLRAAFDYSLVVHPGDAVRLTAYLWRIWYLRGHQEEGMRRAAQAFAAYPGSLPPEPWAVEALRGAGRLALSEGNITLARQRLEQSADNLERESIPDPARAAMLQTEIVLAARAGGDRPGERNALAKRLPFYRAQNDRWAQAVTLSALAEAALPHDIPEQREAWANEARVLEAMFLDAGGADTLARALLDLGEAAVSQGDYGTGIPALRDAFAAFHRSGSEAGAALAKERVARAYFLQGQIDRACREAEEALLLRGNDDRPANDFLSTLLSRA